MDRTEPLPPCRLAPPAPCRPRAGSGKSPCGACAKREACATPCDKLEALLPGEREAEPCPIPVEIAESAGEWRRENGQIRKFLFRIFLKHKRELTRAQRKVVQLVYGDDLSTREAAEKLGITQSAVSQRLTTARGRILRKNLIALRTSGGTQRGEASEGAQEPQSKNDGLAQRQGGAEDGGKRPVKNRRRTRSDADAAGGERLSADQWEEDGR